MTRLETERLLICNYEERHESRFIELFTNESVMKHVDGAMTPGRANKFWSKVVNNDFESTRYVLAINEKETDSYVGNASILPRKPKEKGWEIGFILRKEKWGKGYATEVAVRLIEFCFEELDLERVFATVDDDHESSIKVLRKAGMTFLRYEYDKAGRFSVYGIKRAG